MSGTNQERSEKNTAGQQEANAALAALAAAGNTFALGQLWEINKGLLRSMFWKWYPTHKNQADAHGMTADDFEQEGYFAVQYAAEHYDPGSGLAFSTQLGLSMRRQINLALSNGHRRNITGPDGKTYTISADPLNRCASLDLPIGEDEGGTTLGMMQPDPDAAADMQDVEERIYIEELHAALEEALHKLSEREEKVIRFRFYEQKTVKETAAGAGLEISQARSAEASGLRKLRQNPSLRRWHDEIITTRAYHGTGFSAWANRGSVEERAVEFLESCLERMESPGGEMMVPEQRSKTTQQYKGD